MTENTVVLAKDDTGTDCSDITARTKRNGVEIRGDRILRFPEVVAKINRPRSSIYLMINEGRFPKGVKIGARAIGWRESTVNAWLAAL